MVFKISSSSPGDASQIWVFRFFVPFLEEVRLGFVRAFIIFLSRCSNRVGREGFNDHTGKGTDVISLSPLRKHLAPVMYVLQLE